MAGAEPTEILSGEAGGGMQPQVLASETGRVDVTYGKDNAVYHLVSLDDAHTFSQPVKVGEVMKLALGLRRGPRIAGSGDRLVISAISHEDGNLRAWSSSDGGKTWSDPVVVNDSKKSASEGLHAMAGDGKGNIVLVWLDHRAGAMELWSATSRDGGTTWGANRSVYKSPDGHICECCNPSVAFSPDGEIVAMWRNWLGGSRDLYISRSRDFGATWSAGEKQGSGTWKLNGCPMDGGALAFIRKGALQTVWRREKEIVVAAGGSSSEMKLAAGVQPIVFSLGEQAAYIWQSDSSLYLRRGNSTPAVLARNAAFASVAERADGSAVVVWESMGSSGKTMFAEVLK